MRFIALILIPAATLAGADLRWARYFGGPTAARVRSISTMAVDNGGIIYVAGQYSASDSGPADAFVAAVPPDGSDPLWSTSIGGPGEEITVRLVADHSGNIYVTGRTDSSAFPGVASQDSVRLPLLLCDETRVRDRRGRVHEALVRHGQRLDHRNG